jgi:hypothetical protein
MRSSAILFAALVVMQSMALAQGNEQAHASFDRLTEAFKSFFERRQYLLYLQSYNDSPTKELAYIVRYVPDGDITAQYGGDDSLSQPLTATITLPIFRITNRSCGDVEGVDETVGWGTIAGALADAGSSECYEFGKSEVQTSDPLSFAFAWIDGAWVLQSAMRTKYKRPDVPITSALIGPIETALAITDPAGLDYNKPWIDLIHTK